MQNDFEAALVVEREEARLKHMRDLHEHLLVQQVEFETQMQDILAKQELDIKTKAETDLRVKLGVERSQRLRGALHSIHSCFVAGIVQIEHMFLRLKAVEEVLSSHAEADAVTHKSHMLFLATQELATRAGAAAPLKQQARPSMPRLGWTAS